jgi:DNA polymerase-3 subunit delta
MTITLVGENSYTLKADLKHLVSDFKESHGDLSIEQLEAQEIDKNKFSEALTSLPFLASKKLVVISELSKNKDLSDEAEQLINNLPETTDLVMVETKLDKRLSLYKFLKTKTDFREFNGLAPNELSKWLVQSAKSKGGNLTIGDASYLVERLGTNQLLLSNELDKLLLYSPNVSKESINLLTEQTPQSTIFQLLEVAFRGSYGDVLSLYKEQRALRVEPPQIIAMLCWQLSIVSIIKASGGKTPDLIAKEAKLNPFVVKKSQSIANKLSLNKTKDLISKLLIIDLASKSKNIDTDEALLNYLLDLA